MQGFYFATLIESYEVSEKEVAGKDAECRERDFRGFKKNALLLECLMSQMKVWPGGWKPVRRVRYHVLWVPRSG